MEPTAVISLNGGIGLQAGAEVGLTDKAAVCFDAAKFVSWPQTSSAQINCKGGFGLYPEIRLYPLSRYHARMIIGLQGLYRRLDFSGGYGQFVQDGYIKEFQQASAKSTATGLAAEFGGQFRIARHFYLEVLSGIGGKAIHWQRDGLTNVKTDDSDHTIFGHTSEGDYADDGAILYLIGQVKLAFLIPARRE